MKTVRIYWELTVVMAVLAIGLILGKHFLLKIGLFLPLFVLLHTILGYSLISMYTEWRKKPKRGRHRP